MRDLTYHCEMMDRMGLDQDSVMIIHVGGFSLFGLDGSLPCSFLRVAACTGTRPPHSSVSVSISACCQRMSKIGQLTRNIDAEILLLTFKQYCA